MKLYDCQMAPNPRRARIFLAEKGIECPKQEINIMEGENLKEDYLKVNPFGLLPALELDDGTVIAEAPAIFSYVEANHPEPNLLGNSPLETAQIMIWERFAESQGMGAVGEHFRNKMEPFAERAMPGMTDLKTIPELVERGAKRTAWFYEQIEKRLGESEYLGSDRFTAADITAWCTIDFANAVGLVTPDHCGNIKRWHETLQKRPSASA
ncbi:MAG: glutathione S-transferase family protein [Pseudomonadota bacterium]